MMTLSDALASFDRQDVRGTRLIRILAGLDSDVFDAVNEALNYYGSEHMAGIFTAVRVMRETAAAETGDA